MNKLLSDNRLYVNFMRLHEYASNVRHGNEGALVIPKKSQGDGGGAEGGGWVDTFINPAQIFSQKNDMGNILPTNYGSRHVNCGQKYTPFAKFSSETRGFT